MADPVARLTNVRCGLASAPFRRSSAGDAGRWPLCSRRCNHYLCDETELVCEKGITTTGGTTDTGGYRLGKDALRAQSPTCVQYKFIRCRSDTPSYHTPEKEVYRPAQHLGEASRQCLVFRVSSRLDVWLRKRHPNHFGGLDSRPQAPRAAHPSAQASPKEEVTSSCRIRRASHVALRECHGISCGSWYSDSRASPPARKT